MAATALPRGLPTPPSASAPRRLDEFVGGGPRVPWLAAVLAAVVHRAHVESGWGDALSIDGVLTTTDYRSRAANSISDRSSPASSGVSTTDDAIYATSDRSSPAPYRQTGEAVSRYGTTPSSRAATRRPATSSRRFSTSWEAGGSADGSQFHARQRLDARSQSHQGDVLALSVLANPSARVTLVADSGARVLRHGIDELEGVSILAKEDTEVVTDESEAVSDESVRVPPPLRGCMGCLPQEAVINIARSQFDENSLPLCSGNVHVPVLSTQALTSTILGSMKDDSGRVLRQGIDPGIILTEDGAGEYVRLPPPLRGYMGELPQEIVIRIARGLVKLSIRDAIAMKLACKSWSAAFEISGPMLVVTRQEPASPAVTIFKIATQDNELFPLALVRVNCLYPPPVHTSCWGSCKGLLALKSMTENSIAFHCPTCGFTKPLPDLPHNCDPKGVFLHAENFMISLMTNVTNQNANNEFVLDTTMMFLQQLLTDVNVEDAEDDEDAAEDDIGYDDGEDTEDDADDAAGYDAMNDIDDAEDDSEDTAENDAGYDFDDVDDTAEDDAEPIWFWDVYPGTEQFTPVRTVSFMQNTTFCAATALNMLILDTTDRAVNQPFMTLELGERFASDDGIVTWMSQGQHIFMCGQSAYLCILTRSILDFSNVGVVCFSIEHNLGHELQLVEVNSIGPYSVYLGSNQPLVLGAVDGVPGRSPNTVYIEDNDGIIRNRRVVAINVESQAVQVILFPQDFQFGPLDSIASAWVAPNSESCHLG